LTRCALLGNTAVMVLHREVTMRAVRCLLALAVLAAALPALADDCMVDRAALLALSPDQFDQDLAGGWRPLAEKPGCQLAAADLIAAYRAQPKADGIGLLAWHEAQVRAELGQTPQAVALMKSAYKPAAQDRAGWNLYVDGSIAFLQQDRAALQQARDALARIDTPPGMTVVDGVLIINQNGTEQRIPWPPNLDVLEGLMRCFGKPYRDAYRMACRTPGG
jgi:hypothetical protein